MGKTPELKILYYKVRAGITQLNIVKSKKKITTNFTNPHIRDNGNL